MTQTVIQGAGLGLKRSMLSDVTESHRESIDFFEVAPENWIGVGGRTGRQLRQVREHTPIICHGLSLSIGGTTALNRELVLDIKDFLNELDIPIYSEHLSYTSDEGQLYDLLPLPFTAEAVKHVAARIREVQDMLERRIAIENISYYLVPEQDMSETQFINSLLDEADCDLLLDVNNIYVNSQNHDYDPLDYLREINKEKVSYLHVAGHLLEPDGLIIDTHGADIIDPVWALLDETYKLLGPVPTLLERDFNLPPLSVLDVELELIKTKQSTITDSKAQSAA